MMGRPSLFAGEWVHRHVGRLTGRSRRHLGVRRPRGRDDVLCIRSQEAGMTVLTFPAPTVAAVPSVTAVATGDGLVVRLTGSLTSRNVPALRTLLLAADTPLQVVVDAACVTAADASV